MLVGLLELAPTDPQVGRRLASLVETHAITAEQLGSRLLERALLPEKEQT